MKQYIKMLGDILARGVSKEDRTGVGTTSIFGYQLRHNLEQGFPLLTTKQMFLKGVIHETLWVFILGDTNVKYLNDNGVNCWNPWADENGDLGKTYGYQARRLQYGDNKVDQVAKVVDSIKNDPWSRRHIISLWNSIDEPEMNLPPCHGNHIQFNVTPDENGMPYKLDCSMLQRSCDTFLGVPVNIAQYALLTHMIAHVTNLIPGEMIYNFNDLHIYNNHRKQVIEQLSRNPRPLPYMHIREEAGQTINDFKYKDFTIFGYDPCPAIKAPIAK